MSDQKPTIAYDEFARLDLRAARVLAVSDHPNADRLIVLKIDLGHEQRQIIAGLKGYCSPESLVGKNVVVITNLEPRKMRGMESKGMLLAATSGRDQEMKVFVVTVADDVPPGSPVS